jgi:hypothetical protein
MAVRFSTRKLLLVTFCVAVTVAAWSISFRHGGPGFEPYPIRFIAFLSPFATLGVVVGRPWPWLYAGLPIAFLLAEAFTVFY